MRACSIFLDCTVAPFAIAMKFAKLLLQVIEQTQPEFRDKFLCYKALKKHLKLLPDTSGGASVPSVPFARNMWSPAGGPSTTARHSSATSASSLTPALPSGGRG